MLESFLENLAEKTMQWKTTRGDSPSSRIARGGMQAVTGVSHLKSDLVVLENMLKGLLVQQL